MFSWEEGFIPCGIPNVNLDEDIHEFRCQYNKFLVTVSDFYLGYICLAVLGIIILISIFGGIKEHYRWFILNQAFWDLWISYSFICENNVDVQIDKTYKSTCFYR